MSWFVWLGENMGLQRALFLSLHYVAKLGLQSPAITLTSAEFTVRNNGETSRQNSCLTSGEWHSLGAHRNATDRQRLFSRLLLTRTELFNQKASKRLLTGIQPNSLQSVPALKTVSTVARHEPDLLTHREWSGKKGFSLGSRTSNYGSHILSARLRHEANIYFMVFEISR